MPKLIESLPTTEDGCRTMVVSELNENRMMPHAFEAKLDENTALTREVVDILDAMKGGMKVINWLGSFLKWGAGIAGAVYTIYCIIKGRNPL